MTYAGARLCFDADSHIMELPDFFKEFADRTPRSASRPDRLRRTLGEAVAKFARTKRHEPEDVAEQVALGELVTGPKGYFALGAFNREERGQALDQLGFKRQLVFSTFTASRRVPEDQRQHRPAIRRRPRSQPLDSGFYADPRLRRRPLVLGLARAGRDRQHREARSESRVDPAPACSDKSPGHLDLDPIWAKLADSIPFALHVGGDPLQMDPAWMNNGRQMPTDWLGGEPPRRGHDGPAPRRRNCISVFDGVFQRHPKLKGVVHANSAAAGCRNFSCASTGRTNPGRNPNPCLPN